MCTHMWTFLLQNGASWDICLMRCGICQMGLLNEAPSMMIYVGSDLSYHTWNLCWTIVFATKFLCIYVIIWWRHQMETFSALLAICAGNSPGEFPAQRTVTRSFDVFFDLRLNQRLSKQSWGWWFETLPSPLWRHCNDNYILVKCMS